MPDDEAELQTIERERLVAFVSGDIETLQRLHAPDFQLINPGGQELSRRDYLNGIAAGFIQYRVWEPDGEIAVRAQGDMAVLRYRAEVEVAVQGETQPRQRYWQMELYEKRDTRWQAVWSQATRVST